MPDTQSQLAQRIKRMLRAKYPDFDFTKYAIQWLRPTDREHGNRPAWSVGAYSADGRLFSFYSGDTMTEVAEHGIQEVTRDGSSVMLMAGFG